MTRENVSYLELKRWAQDVILLSSIRFISGGCLSTKLLMSYRKHSSVKMIKNYINSLGNEIINLAMLRTCTFNSLLAASIDFKLAVLKVKLAILKALI